MTTTERFVQNVRRVLNRHPSFAFDIGLNGDGWLEVIMAPGAIQTSDAQAAFRSLGTLANATDVALVVRREDIHDMSLDALYTDLGFEWWMNGTDGFAIMRPRSDWSCSLDRQPGYSFESAATMTQAMAGAATIEAFERLVDDLLDPAEWPDRGKAADRLRVAMSRSVDHGPDAVLADLGHEVTVQAAL